MLATTQEVLNHHLECVGTGDLDGLMSDYTSDSKLFTPHGVLEGTTAIREMFVGMFAEFAKPGAWYQVAIADLESDGLLGGVALHFLADDHRQLELGCTLAPASHLAGASPPRP